MAEPFAVPSRFSVPGVRPVLVLMVVQLVCTLIFLSDVIDDLLPRGGETLDWRIAASEIAAVTGLLLGLVFEAVVLRRLLMRQGQMAKSLAAAQGALGDLMESYFRTWSLTPTEADVAAFTIKGFSIAEIAQLRGSAEGTIKTHLNAIYRKSGTSGRAQLVSVLVEDLFHGALAGSTAGTGPKGGAQAPHPADAVSAGRIGWVSPDPGPDLTEPPTETPPKRSGPRGAGLASPGKSPILRAGHDRQDTAG